MKLGKLAPRIDPRTLRLSKYLGAALPAPPNEVDWTSGIVDWGMMGNDQLGDCTCAALGHAIQAWSAATGPEYTPPDSDVIGLYESACGYNPADPSTDQGGVELNVLNYVRQNGLFDDSLTGYADPDPGDTLHIKQSIQLFGGVYIGLQLPLSAQSQIGQLWTPTGDTAGSWGGHAVFVCAYDPETLTCITWGKLQKMSWEFWSAYCDESHTLLSASWLSRAPSDFQLGDLMNDLSNLNA